MKLSSRSAVYALVMTKLGYAEMQREESRICSEKAVGEKAIVIDTS